MSVPYQSSVSTSEAAARSIEPHVDRLESVALLAYLSRMSPLTDEEMGEIAGLDGNTARPRRVNLFKKGLVVLYDTRGKTKAGRSAQRFGLSERGIEVGNRLSRKAAS